MTSVSTAFRHAASSLSSSETRAARAQARATCSSPIYSKNWGLPKRKVRQRRAFRDDVSQNQALTGYLEPLTKLAANLLAERGFPLPERFCSRLSVLGGQGGDFFDTGIDGCPQGGSKLRGGGIGLRQLVEFIIEEHAAERIKCRHTSF